MKKIKLIGCLIITLGLSFAIIPKLTDAFSFQTVCQPPLTKFSNGSSTFDISFPPATTCDTFPPADSNCPIIMLPAKGTVFSMKVDIASKGTEIGTPYIWVPVSAGADGNHIKQIDTDDCSIIESYPTGSNPSRTFVIPGGDVWVGNRDSGNVTKLSPLNGNQPAGGTCEDGLCGTDETLYSCPVDCSGNVCGAAGNQDCKKYKVAGNYATGAGPRGVTGDISGNVWVGNYSSSNVSKLDPATGAKLITDIAVGGNPYGLIGDPFGHIWISNRSAGYFLQCLKTDSANTETSANLESVYSLNYSYGIGMDSTGNIYVACYECGTVLKFDAVTAANCPATMTPSATYNTGRTSGTRGVAVDQRGYVWTSNSGSNKFYVFTDPATRYEVSPGSTNVLGAAIDFDGFGWTASYDSGNVYKYSFDGASFNLECSANVNGNPYNYSDMTGLRTIPKTLSAVGISVPLSPTGTFEICTDGTTTCSDATPCAVITAYLATCTPDTMNNCEVPLEIFSTQAGDYTLKNLEVIYGKKVPVTTGGLVPCGREWNDLNTPWNDKAPCNFCHLVILASLIINFLMELVILISILALVVAGLIYVKTGGDSSLITAAKQNVNKILYGFVIVFIAWAIINLIMILLGFNDPIGDGSWKIFSCDL